MLYREISSIERVVASTIGMLMGIRAQRINADRIAKAIKDKQDNEINYQRKIFEEKL